MPTVFEQIGDRVVARLGGETIWLEPCGTNGARVRTTRNRAIDEHAISALLETDAPDTSWDIDEDAAALTNGRLRAELRLLARGMGPALELRFVDAVTGALLLEEEMPHILWPASRHYKPQEGDLWHVEQRFKARDGEQFFGLGQHQHGKFDQKGCVVDLAQANTEISIPFLVSSCGYGLIWNNPGVGRVELAENRSLWVMDATAQLDYVVIAGETPASILNDYTALTGRPPELPDWALGFWQCKLRYKTQEEVLEIAREHKRRGLPLDCLVIDFFHWTKMGEWRFNAQDFPDPSAMVAELRAMGVTPMVSVWPSVNANAETWGELHDNGWMVQSKRGALDGMIFYDREPDAMNALAYYDATHPDARAFHWSRVKKGYADHGIHAFWLDANEPEMYPMHRDNLRFWAGDGQAVANVYPVEHQKGYAKAFQDEGFEDGVMLSRSAWLGTQRYPVVVWSGDVKSTFADFRRQIRAGLNMAMSGIPWWTTDIGGFKGGDVNDPAFHELLIRWFQFGALCPIFRLHGFRKDASRDERFGELFSFGGADNEVWSFGDDVYAILERYMHLRERLKPYLRACRAEATATGTPVMRPLLFGFPDDPSCWTQDDSYLLGPDLLVAPILEADATSREVYLPKGTDWEDAWTGTQHQGGQTFTTDAPLDRIPVFKRAGSDVRLV
ncbi:TIM-barrel domain-containing protein [Ahrensia marina]|uniref:glycoside hydrolase family 31 protein n=1 Tax=Ahrensia marina TaxID=1514904 RepID=UPI0035CEE792